MQRSNELEIRIAPQEGCCTVCADGIVSIDTAGALRDALLAELRTGTAVVLDLSAVQDIDLSGLQLICSAHRSWIANDSVLELRGIPEKVRQVAGAAGYDLHRSTCPRREN